MSAAGTGSYWSERGLLVVVLVVVVLVQRCQDQSSAVFCNPDDSLETLMVHSHVLPVPTLLHPRLVPLWKILYLVCGTYRCRVVLWNSSWSMRLNSSAVFFWLPPESSKYKQSGAPVIPCSYYTVLCHSEYDIQGNYMLVCAKLVMMIRCNKVGLTMVLLHCGNATKTV